MFNQKFKAIIIIFFLINFSIKIEGGKNGGTGYFEPDYSALSSSSKKLQQNKE